MILINIFKIFFIIFIILLLVLYLYFQYQYKHWIAKKIPYIKPVFPLGNILRESDGSSFSLFKKLYDESKDKKICGVWLFFKPVLMINDPDLIQKILIKNFEQFHSNGSYFNKENNPFAGKII